MHLFSVILNRMPGNIKKIFQVLLLSEIYFRNISRQNVSLHFLRENCDTKFLMLVFVMIERNLTMIEPILLVLVLIVLMFVIILVGRPLPTPPIPPPGLPPAPPGL